MSDTCREGSENILQPVKSPAGGIHGDSRPFFTPVWAFGLGLICLLCQTGQTDASVLGKARPEEKVRVEGRGSPGKV